MRALLLSRLVKGELSRILRPPPLLMKYASLSSSAHSEDEPTKKKRKRRRRSDYHILGPDHPYIWTPRSSAPPVPSSSSQAHGMWPSRIGLMDHISGNKAKDYTQGEV
ncbi:uncharacterized protein A4U43_C02F11870 [Asparagus officinalis]|uniref:Uncharacterized protein n=1 Tax=Asparagus officinalis TaxID=4686 RepID=A0A5P1FIH6_ASPOF|nr:uncharacterized protein A4U43_C02F11870 [Asparagus officinalis]